MHGIAVCGSKAIEVGLRQSCWLSTLPRGLHTGSHKQHSLCHTVAAPTAFRAPAAIAPKNAATTAQKRRPEAAHLQELQAITMQALTMNENMSKMMESLYERIQELQQQNMDLMVAQQDNLVIQREHLDLAEMRLKRVQELQERDQFCQDMINKMQVRLDILIQALTRNKPISVDIIEQMSGNGDDPNLAAKLLQDLCRDPVAVEANKREAIPLAVKLLRSPIEDVQEIAAMTLLSLVTKDATTVAHMESCEAANRLGAGFLVTGMLQPSSNETVHASVLPLWNVLTMSEMLCRN